MKEHDEDAVWRHIVDNYGERAQLDDDQDAAASTAQRPAPALEDSTVQPDSSSEPTEMVDLPEPVEDPQPTESANVLDPPDERFIPPPPPPLPRPRGPRGLAWLGLLGSPLVLVVFVVTGTYLPPALAGALALAFVAGFGYLVWTMPSGPRDPWDNGARV